MWYFDEWFNNVRFDRHISTFQNIWNAKDFEVWLGLGETSILDVICINIVAVLDIFANNTDLQLECNSVGSDDEITMIYANEVNCEVSLGVFQKAVKIHYMFAGYWHELVCIVCAHGNDNLLSWEVFGYHIDPRPGFIYITKYSLVDLLNLFIRKLRKVLLNFEDITDDFGRNLSIQRFAQFYSLLILARSVLTIKLRFF